MGTTSRGDSEYSGQRKPKRTFPFEIQPKFLESFWHNESSRCLIRPMHGIKTRTLGVLYIMPKTPEISACVTDETIPGFSFVCNAG